MMRSALTLLALAALMPAQATHPRFRIVVLAEHGGIHAPFVAAAKSWLGQEAAKQNFAVDYLEDTAPIDAAFLSHYALFLQLNFPPYGWTPTAAAAFERYIENGQGGWVGFHHASLVGEFDGYPMWPWFHRFIGDIRWKDYIRDFSTATVMVEDPTHPVMRGLPRSFTINDEEWYTYDHSPRPAVHVLASVDENTYQPPRSITMGDHPVVWTNPHFRARNIYIFMGHRPEHFANPAFTRLFENSLLWAASRA